MFSGGFGDTLGTLRNVAVTVRATLQRHRSERGQTALYQNNKAAALLFQSTAAVFYALFCFNDVMVSPNELAIVLSAS